MKKKIALLLSLLSLSLSGQIHQDRNGDIDELVFYISTVNTEYDKAEGSRYLNATFVPARINGLTETQFIRFNVVENTIELKKNDGKGL